MAIPLIGSPPPSDPGAMLQRITGDSQDFAATVGNWTATAGTVTRQTTYTFPYNGHPNANAAALRWAVTTNGAKLSCPVAGPFKAGRSYAVIVAFGHDAAYSVSDRGMWVRFGLIGTDSEGSNTFQPQPINAGSPPASWQVIRRVWRPTANRSSATIELETMQAVTMNWYVGMVMAFEINPGQAPDLLAWPGAYEGYFIGGYWGRVDRTVDEVVSMATNEAGWQVSSQGQDFSGYTYLGVQKSFGYLASEHVPGDRTGEGVNVEVGDDYVGLMISEAAADEVQIHPDFDDYWITLLDGDAPGAAKGWRASDEAGNKTGLLSKSPFRHLAAAPGSPAEGEVYYDTVLDALRVYANAAWVTLGAAGAGGIPATIVDAKGDLIVATAADTVARLPVGTNTQVLTADSAESSGVKWAAAPGAGSGIPETLLDAKGDLIAASAADTAARLAVGTNGDLLTADSAESLGVKWAASPGIPNTIGDAKGDVIGFSAADTPVRLPVGSNGQLLTADSAESLGVKWAHPVPLLPINFILDGAGSTISTGLKGFVRIERACTITSVDALADVSGSIVVDIWKDTYANHPPVNADSITASAPVTISSAVKSTDATLTGWTTALAAGDILAFNVDSAATVTLVTIVLHVVAA